MSIFKRKKITISERDPTYKVQYLGNVQTTLMKGEGCVDKPAGVLWNNYIKNNNSAINMKLILSATGLKVVTKEQGLTEYRANKMSYCIAHPNYPKMFIWVYRHEGKRLKVELRCHAIIAKSVNQAKSIAVQLHDRLTLALSDFMRLKTRRQNARLALQRTYSLPTTDKKLTGGTLPNPGSGVSGIPARSMYLTTGQNFKISIDKSSSAPKLGAITESVDEDEEFISVLGEDSGDDDSIDFQCGNDVDELRKDLINDKELSTDIENDSDSYGDEEGTSESSSLSGSVKENEVTMQKSSEDFTQGMGAQIDEETLL